VESGSFKPLRHVFVDSMSVRSKILDVLPLSSVGSESMELTDREISVFLFSTNYPYPVLVDRTLQAKGMFCCLFVCIVCIVLFVCIVCLLFVYAVLCCVVLCCLFVCPFVCLFVLFWLLFVCCLFVLCVVCLFVCIVCLYICLYCLYCLLYFSLIASNKALSDAVVATQSNFPSHPSRVQCNGEPILVDLRDPSREMLAAIALTVGGIIPPHLSYSHETKCVTQEWLWSVGGTFEISFVNHWRL
jgi:hypothetical protein